MTKLTPEQRSEIARKGGKAGGRGRKKAAEGRGGKKRGDKEGV